MGRQMHDEARAMALDALDVLHGNAAQGALHQATGHREPKPGTLAHLLGGDKRLKQSVLYARINTWSIVLDREHPICVRGLIRPPRDDADAAPILTSVSRVHEQVE